MSEPLPLEHAAVVDKREWVASLNAARDFGGVTGFWRGMVGGLAAAALQLLAIRLVVGPFVGAHLMAALAGLVFGLVVAVLLYRMSGNEETMTVGYWTVEGFAARLKQQWEEEARGGRTDG